MRSSSTLNRKHKAGRPDYQSSRRVRGTVRASRQRRTSHIRKVRKDLPHASIPAKLSRTHLNASRPARPRYYVKVAAENSAGAGVGLAASPTSAYPSQQTPGIPVGLVARNDTADSATVSWDFPLVPTHGIPCFGTEETPTICPTPVGGVYPGSDGGDDVYEYRIQWSTSLG